eukprot:6128153-Ditylum_brightwellii.AAC.1
MALDGPHNFNAHPMALLGTKTVVHKTVDKLCISNQLSSGICQHSACIACQSYNPDSHQFNSSIKTETTKCTIQANM